MIKENEMVMKKAVRLYKKGYAIKDIATHIEKSYNTTTKILVNAGVHTVKTPLTPEQRNKIIEMLLTGETLTKVAKTFGVDRDYVRKLAYRTNDAYYVENDKLAIKSNPVREQQVESSAKHEPTTKTFSFSEMDKEKECITTILLDAMIKSEEGNQLLRNKGFMPVAKHIEAAVEAIIN